MEGIRQVRIRFVFCFLGFFFFFSFDFTIRMKIPEYIYRIMGVALLVLEENESIKMMPKTWEQTRAERN